MFDANLLDELAVVPASVISTALRTIGRTTAEGIGAVVEYELYRRNNRTDLPPLVAFCESPITNTVIELLEGPMTRLGSLSLQPVPVDAAKIPLELWADPLWAAFLKRAEATALVAGFAELVSAGLAGAIAELADNVIQHSKSPGSGVAAFCRRNNGFEYVVADSGIGMLASLKDAPEFRSLRDDIEALPLAILPGVSRRGRGTGSGYGYRAVFSPLQAVNGSVRLRSGQAVLNVAGYGPRPNQGRCSQRPTHQGVVVTVAVIPNI